MSTIELRAATPADLNAIVSVFQRARAHGLEWLPVLHDHDEDLGFFGQCLRNLHTTIAVIDGAAVGFAMFGDDKLHQLHVDPDWWSIGVGRTLLRQIMHDNPSGFGLYTFERNTRARRFYEFTGFKAVRFGANNEEQMRDVWYEWAGGAIEPPDSYEIRERVRLRRAVRGVILDDTDRVLLAQWHRPDFDEDRWILPGGGVKVGESLHQALARELHEETGLIVERPVPLIWVITTRVVGNPRWGGQINHIFLLRVSSFEPNPAMTPEQLAAEHMVGVRWWAPDELAQQPDVLGPRPIPAMLADLRRHGPPARPLVLDARP